MRPAPALHGVEGKKKSNQHKYYNVHTMKYIYSLANSLPYLTNAILFFYLNGKQIFGVMTLARLAIVKRSYVAFLHPIGCVCARAEERGRLGRATCTGQD